MTQGPLLSVIMPIFNGAETLERSIRSVLVQSFKDFELIIVNDGSTDATEKMISSIKDKRIIYFRQENRGAAAARNHGVNVARGKYLSFLDADDIYKVDFLKTGLEILTKYDVYDCVKFMVETNKEVDIFWKMSITNSIPTNMILKKIVFDIIGGFPEDGFFKQYGSEDVVFSTLLNKYFNVLVLKDSGLIYNWRPGNFFDKQLKKFQLPPGKYEYSAAEKQIAEKVKQAVEEQENIMKQKNRIVLLEYWQQKQIKKQN